MLLAANQYNTTTQKHCLVLSSSLGYGPAGHDSSESLRAPTSAGDTALDAAGSGQGQTPPAAEQGLSLPAPEAVKEQLARSVQEDVAKAKDSLREGQAALVRLRTHARMHTRTHAQMDRLVAL